MRISSIRAARTRTGILLRIYYPKPNATTDREKMDLKAYFHNKTVFDLMQKDGRTTERRRHIDISALRQSYESGEHKTYAWIPGNVIAADTLDKKTNYKDTDILKTMETKGIRSARTYKAKTCDKL